MYDFFFMWNGRISLLHGLSAQDIARGPHRNDDCSALKEELHID